MSTNPGPVISDYCLADALGGSRVEADSTSGESGEQCGAELGAHRAVDEEISGIAEQYQQVDEYRGRVAGLRSDDLHPQRVLYNHNDKQDTRTTHTHTLSLPL